jgi:hypothetical protein
MSAPAMSPVTRELAAERPRRERSDRERSDRERSDDAPLRPRRASAETPIVDDVERPKPERSSAEAPRHEAAERPRRERARGETPALRRGPRPPRAAGPTFSEEGFSYEVRDMSAGDLAAIGDASAPPISSGAVLDMAAPSPEAGVISNWDGPVDEAFVNVGRDDGVRTSDLHQALSTAGVSEGDTAYVRIRQRHTFIGVRQGLLDRVVSGLNGQKIAQRLVEAQPARPRQVRR